LTMMCWWPSLLFSTTSLRSFKGLWWTADKYCDMLVRSDLKDDVVWAFRPLLSGATIMTPATETFDATPSDSQWLDSHSHLFHLVFL
jgi:hypothetical protein